MRLGAQAARAADRQPRRHRAGGGAQGGRPKERSRRQHLLARGLAATADRWPARRTAYGGGHQAAHRLANPEEQPGDAVRADDQTLLATMAAQRATRGALAPAVDQFVKGTASSWPGRCHGDDVPGVPRTTNHVEQYFGSARYHARRASGRTGASPGLAVRGAVRVVAAVVTREHAFDEVALRPADLAAWRSRRRHLAPRQAARCAQRRFRRDPDAHLAALEGALFKLSLPA